MVKPKLDIFWRLHRRLALGMAAWALAAALSACNAATPVVTNPPQPPPSAATSTSGPTQAAAPTSLPSPTVPASPTAETPTSTPEATSAPQVVSLDPCALLPDSEASALAGVTFGPGKQATLSNGGKTCVYSSQGTNIFFVEVIQAPDVATAQAYKTQFLTDLQSQMPELSNAGIQTTEVPNFADGAISGQVSQSIGPLTANASMFGFLKGKTFFGFSDVSLGGTAPDSAAMQAQANTVLGRLP